MPLSWDHLYTVITVKFWVFFTWGSSPASKRGNLGHNQMCCAFVHQKEIWCFSIPMRFRDRCWYLLSFGLFLVFCFRFMGIFFHWVIWGFFMQHQVLLVGVLKCSTLLNKCETAPKWVFFLSQGGFVVCFLWQLLFTKTLTLQKCACGMNYSAQQGKKGHFKVHFDF